MVLFKRKLVLFGGSTLEPWHVREPKLKKQRFSRIRHFYASATNGFDFETKTPPDVHLFYEIYEPRTTYRPNKLWYKIVGSPELPDFTEYEDDVESIDFTGYVCNIKTAIEITRQLPNCKNVLFVLGEVEQRCCPSVCEDGVNEVVDLCPVNHVTNLIISFPQPPPPPNKGCVDPAIKKFDSFAHIQIQKILRQARYNFPNLEEIKINVPWEEDTFKMIRNYLPSWKKLKCNYDVQIIQNIVQLAKLSKKVQEHTDKVDESPNVLQDNSKPVQNAEKIAAEVAKDQEKVAEKSAFSLCPIIIPTERVIRNHKSQHIPNEEEGGHDEEAEKAPHQFHDCPDYLCEKHYQSSHGDMDSNRMSKPYRRKRSTSPGDPYSYHRDGKRTNFDQDGKLVAMRQRHGSDGSSWNTSGDGENEDYEDSSGICDKKDGYEDRWYGSEEDDKGEYDEEDIKPDIKPAIPNNLDYKPVLKIPLQEFLTQFSRRPCKEQLSGQIVEELVIPIGINGELQFHEIHKRQYPAANLHKMVE